jgi:hypothetical protein
MQMKARRKGTNEPFQKVASVNLCSGGYILIKDVEFEQEPIVHDVEIITDTVTISKDRYEQLLQYEQEYISRQSMINSFMQNK